MLDVPEDALPDVVDALALLLEQPCQEIGGVQRVGFFVADGEEQLAARDREARKGVIYSTPAQFCGCVVAEGLKERVDLAAFTATLRLYTPPAIRRLEEGAMLHDAKACGTVPSV